MEPRCKHLRVDALDGNDGPLRGRRVTTDRCTGYTGRVGIGRRAVAIVLNGPVYPGLLEVPLRDRESRETTTRGTYNLGIGTRGGRRSEGVVLGG